MSRLHLQHALGSVALLFFTAAGALGCSSETSGGTSSGSTSTGGPVGPCDDVASPNETLSVTSDPEGSAFTLDKALAGLPPGPGPLRAIIDTDLGVITCSLNTDKAPIGVASFVGLARGQRPWQDPKTNKWVKRRYYDGLLFHRVIPDFVAQGGDPLGTGSGGPGFKLPDEISDLSHVPGALAYANSGPNSSGSQFYITETALTELDGDYTVFGLCTPLSVVVKLTHVETDMDRPVKDLHMKTISITRCAP
jgi:peptidyl-prolyl cis-trans isomerase A (cyclophilin A)